MSINGWFQILLYCGIVVALVPALGWMTRVFNGERTNVLRALFDLLCGFLFCRFSFHRHASSRRLKTRFDMIRGELAIGRGNRATTLYSVDPRGSVP